MEEAVESAPPSRSLGATLLAAASTFGIFIMANWELGIAIDCKPRKPALRDRCLLFLKHAAAAVLFPFLPFMVSSWNVWCVWQMRRKLQEKRTQLKSWGAVAIMTFILELPADHELHEIPHKEKCLHALELSPHDDADKNQDHQPHIDVSVSGGDGDNTRENQDQPPQVKNKVYINMRPRYVFELFFDRSLWMNEREALLELGLVPENEQLKMLRARSPFRAVVTWCQALGYMLGVVQRLAQHVAVSPLETIVSFLCLHVALQLLMELYACSHYQRPLLLRLQPHQHSSFINERASNPREFSVQSKPILMFLFRSIFMVALPVFLMPAPVFYYALSFRHNCLPCSLSTFFLSLFPLASIASLLTLILFMACIRFVISICPNTLRDRSEDFVEDFAGRYFLVFFLVCAAFVFASSIVLATMATIQEWALFKTRTSDLSFDWILPHVSS